MIVFQAEHNILMHPFHMLGVAGVFGGESLKTVERETFFFFLLLLQNFTKRERGEIQTNESTGEKFEIFASSSRPESRFLHLSSSIHLPNP
jgi:hypothetical protein